MLSKYTFDTILKEGDLILLAGEPIEVDNFILSFIDNLSAKIPVLYISLNIFKNLDIPEKDSIYIENNVKSIAKIKEKIQKYKKENEVGLIIINGLLPSNYSEEDIKEIRNIASQLNIFILVSMKLFNLSKKEIFLSDIGILEKYADFVLLIQKKNNSSKVFIAKNRYGNTGMAKLFN